MKTHRLKYYFFNTLLTVVLCAVYCCLGNVFSFAAGLLIAALLAMVMYHEHFGLGIANAILVLIVFTFFLSPVPAIAQGIPFILLGISLSVGSKLKMKLHHVVMLCSVLCLLDLLVKLKLAGGAMVINAALLETGELLRKTMQAKISGIEHQALLEQTISTSLDITRMLTPALFMIVCIVCSYVLVCVYKKMQKVQTTDMSFWIPFNQFQGDKLFAVLFLVLLVLLTTSDSGMFFAAVVNVVLVISFLFFVIGVSVFNYKLKQKGTDSTMRKFLTAALICFSTMFFMIPIFFLIFYGLTDAFFDYRGLRPKDAQDSRGE